MMNSQKQEDRRKDRAFCQVAKFEMTGPYHTNGDWKNAKRNIRSRNY